PCGSPADPNPNKADTPHRRNGNNSDKPHLRCDPQYRDPHYGALYPGTFHPVIDLVPCRLLSEKLARITSQRGDGILCVGDRSWRHGRPVVGWLDPFAVALAL